MVGRAEVIARFPELENCWDAADASFPIRITRSFWRDLSGPVDGPLARQVLPDPRELLSDPGDLADPVGDAAMSPVPWVVHKYPNRALLLMTKRCHLYCRYCFRRNHKPGEREDPTADEWQNALEYLETSTAKEIILSGGDPLAVHPDRLFRTIDQIQRWGKLVRVHTRAPITAPHLISEDFTTKLGERSPLWLVLHINHENELNEAVCQAIDRLRRAGISLLSQSVLLRGVNDSATTLAALFERLVRLGVSPYYLHHPDAAAGNAHFRLSIDEGLAIVKKLGPLTSGISRPRYMLDPSDGSGKVEIKEKL